MGGSAVLDQAVLVDSLVDVIDELRDDLHPQFGVRPYRVFTVRRTWPPGNMVGQGSPTDVATELRPQPHVSYRTRYEMTPAGTREVGEVILTEVSLTYTFDELVGGALTENVEWLYRLSEANGQGQPDTYHVLARPPVPDRDEDIGWTVVLRKASTPGCPP